MKNVQVWTGLKTVLLLTCMILGSCESKQLGSTTSDAHSTSSDVVQTVTKPYKNISVSDAKGLLDTANDYVFLDVRTPGEVADGQISGSITIDINSSSFEEEISKLDKQKPYVVYCKSGGRSTKAAKIMQSQGFENVSNMEGGYSAWNKAYK